MKALILAGVLVVAVWVFHRPQAPGPQDSLPGGITVTVLFDNLQADDRLQTGWGFAALVETPEHTVLFDTGADGEILLENMRLMGKDPLAIEALIISHAHGDHTGGLQALLDLGINPRIYLLEAFPAPMRQALASSQETVLSADGEEIVPGIRTTGQVGTQIPEQAVVLEAAVGPVLLTGCAHPGILEMVGKAEEVAGEPIHTVLGGFHLMAAEGAVIQEVVEGFLNKGIVVAGPTHCSGLVTMTAFQGAYGENFQRLGVGRVLKLPM